MSHRLFIMFYVLPQVVFISMGEVMFSEKLIHKLQNSKHLVVLTGAGVSAESGIPTFRDAENGLWKDFDLHKVATEWGYIKNPAFAWGWYEWARNKASFRNPNPAHETIAMLENKIPKVVVVTQNVDDLHERAGSTKVLHIHGTLNEMCCMSCNHKESLPKITSPEMDLPEPLEPEKCQLCSGLMRPNVVWFGDLLPQDIFTEAKQACEQCDLMLIIGTSGLIYPAASLADRAIQKKIETVQINPESTDIDTLVTHNFRGKAGEILPKLFDLAFGGGNEKRT